MRHGEGRQAKRARVAWRRARNGIDLHRQQRAQEGGVGRLVGPGLLQLGGQGLGRRTETQRGQVSAQVLVGGGLAHAPTSSSALAPEVSISVA